MPDIPNAAIAAAATVLANDNHGSTPGSADRRLAVDVLTAAVPHLGAGMTPSAVEMLMAPCPAQGHVGQHLQFRTHEHWICGHILANMLIASEILPDTATALTIATDALTTIRDGTPEPPTSLARTALDKIGALSQ